VTPADAAGSAPAVGMGRVRAVGVLLLLLLVALTAWQAPWSERLQAAWFDAQQVLLPRPVAALPVTVVEIDQKSLLALGQWPWPRTELARLIDALQDAGPAAIGVDILMPEPDALSPERLLAASQADAPDAAVAAALRSLMSNDVVLARALARAPTVLVVAGTHDPTGVPVRAPAISVRGAGRAAGGDAGEQAPAVTRFGGALSSLDELDRQASGRGLITVDTTRGIVRRMPLVASVQGTLVPALAIEMLRVAYRAPALGLITSGKSVTALGVGALRVPTEADGAVRPYFSRHRPDRFVSAIDVMHGRVDPARLHRQLVLIGTTAIGLEAGRDTPVGEVMGALEIQAQLLENLLEGSLLRRPGWAPWAEAGLLLLLGAAFVWAAPRLSPLAGAGALLASSLAALALGVGLFRGVGLLLDTVTPVLHLMLLSAVMLALTLTESNRQRRTLRRVLQTQREEGARMAGELQAAQRIQLASLPKPEVLGAEPRIDLHACLTAAREVGGDLYDFYRLDSDRLFLMIGDVAGKGLSASIFMAVSKALMKGAVLRAPQAGLGEVMCAIDAEVSRDNAEMLFVTAFAAVLDLRSGRLEYCNAGHDDPCRLPPDAGEVSRIRDGDGPPLCAATGFPYGSAVHQLVPGEWLCLVTDGVTEAQDPSGALYGSERVQRFIVEHAPRARSARELVLALQADVNAFAAGAEPSDDLTILALRWNGPALATGA